MGELWERQCLTARNKAAHRITDLDSHKSVHLTYFPDKVEDGLLAQNNKERLITSNVAKAGLY